MIEQILALYVGHEITVMESNNIWHKAKLSKEGPGWVIDLRDDHFVAFTERAIDYLMVDQDSLAVYLRD